MKVRSLTTFTDLGLAAPLLKALDEESYTMPTPIQAQAIPGVMAGRDLLGIAQTGTGKTAAFALPILHRLAADPRAPMRKGSRVLVLSPTRELATQIAESFRTYGRHMGTTVAVVFGGVGHRPQINALARGVDILVATPGRLLDHMGERNISIEGTEIFVLDEADQMLDLGFVKPIRQIVRHLAARRQSLFFSATMPHEIGALAAELLRDPLRVSVAPAATTVERVSQRVIHVEQTKKRSLLVELLADQAMQRTLIFTRTKRGADRVARHLDEAKITVAAIHGNKSQRQREEALESFRIGDIRVLVATDIAARGIDIDSVTHVINYELPDVPESYVHRIGRTARAGAEGVAISLVDGEERQQLRDIERITRQQIASEDRRGDASLIAIAAGPRREGGDGERRGRRPERPAQNRGQRSAGPERSARGERSDRPRQNGERRFGDRSARPERSGSERGPDRGPQHRSARPVRNGDDRAPDQRPGEPHMWDAQVRKPNGNEARPAKAGDRSFQARGGERAQQRDRSGQPRDRNGPNRDGDRNRSRGGERRAADARQGDRPQGGRPQSGSEHRKGDQAGRGQRRDNARGNHPERSDNRRRTERPQSQ